MYSSVLFSVRERKSPAESFLKFKRNVEFPTGAVRAKFGCIVDSGASFRHDTNRRVVRNVVRVKQKESPGRGLGKLGGTAEFIRPLHRNV